MELSPNFSHSQLSVHLSQITFHKLYFLGDMLPIFTVPKLEGVRTKKISRDCCASNARFTEIPNTTQRESDFLWNKKLEL